MQANQTKIQSLLDSQRQYVIPLFQRPYSWEASNWDTLWQDLIDLCEEQNPRPHFLGSIVTMPAKSVPEGVTKFILIDGQQRLTTLLILLAVIRDHSKGRPCNLSDKIEDVLLRNRHQEATDVYKLLPSRDDRPAFFSVMDGRCSLADHQICLAYQHFERKLRLNRDLDLDHLYQVIRNGLVLVSIVLDTDDNPHLIFESLNAKGKPLSQADLIRNFLFMRIHSSRQDKMFDTAWRPMQAALGDTALTEFIRHYLMRAGKVVKQGDVYLTLKDRVGASTEAEVVEYIRDLARYSGYYAKLLYPSTEPFKEVAERLSRLNRYQATTAYPFLLDVYSEFDNGRLSPADFTSILDMVEGFVVRRFICGVVTSGLTKIFPTLFAQARTSPSLVDGVRLALREKNYPRDSHFRESFIAAKLYGGERSAKAKLILERLEQSFGHKESVGLSELSIEHVLPQSPTDWWKSHLGVEWEAVHDEWLHTIGNLTLSGYNSELSNSDFPTKKKELAKSHVELNRHFASVDRWDEKAIYGRGEALADLAVTIWPDISPKGAITGQVVEEPEEVQEDVEVLVGRGLDRFGGEVDRVGKAARVFYRTADGKVINIKHSKRHPSYYWFGYHSSLLAELPDRGVTHVVFILLPDRFVTLPVAELRQYLSEAGSSPKPDGSVRHFHILISTDSPPEMFHHGRLSRTPLSEHVSRFD
jgi:uncharacterized protein with ParB-like and HNH nuclease domain